MENDYGLMSELDKQSFEQLLRDLYFIIQQATKDVHQYGQASIDTQKKYIAWEYRYKALKEKVYKNVNDVSDMLDDYMLDWYSDHADWEQMDKQPEDWMNLG